MNMNKENKKNPIPEFFNGQRCPTKNVSCILNSLSLTQDELCICKSQFEMGTADSLIYIHT